MCMSYIYVLVCVVQRLLPVVQVQCTPSAVQYTDMSADGVQEINTSLFQFELRTGRYEKSIHWVS